MIRLVSIKGFLKNVPGAFFNMLLLFGNDITLKVIQGLDI